MRSCKFFIVSALALLCCLELRAAVGGIVSGGPQPVTVTTSTSSGLNNAVASVQGSGTVYIEAGNYDRTFKLDLARAKGLKLIGKGAVNVYFGTNITSFVDEGAGRYAFEFSNDSWAYVSQTATPFIFVRGGTSQERFIPFAERQPVQYNHNFAMRDFARVTNVTVLAGMANGQFHVSNNTIRFKFPDGAAPGGRTVQIPERYQTNSFLYNGQSYSDIEVQGVNVYFAFAGFDVTGSKRSVVRGCRALGSYDCGWLDGDKKGFALIEDCEFGANYNDGVAATSGNADKTNTTFVTVGRRLWLHDNGSTGWSDHGGSVGRIEHSFAEWNRTTGFVAYGGGRTECIDCRSDNNDVGFQAAGPPTLYNAGWTNVYSTMIMDGCYTDQCRIGVSHDFISDQLFVEARNSWLGANIPFGYTPVASDGNGARPNTIMRLFNCVTESEAFLFGGGGGFYKPVTILGQVSVGTNVANTTTAVLDFPSTTAATSTNLTVALTGAADGDIITISVPTGSVLPHSCYTGWASNGVVYVSFNNYRAIAQDPPSGTFRVRANKF